MSNKSLEEPVHHLIPIYTTRGDVGAILLYPNLFNLLGEWIGWVSANRKIYSVHGQYVGNLTNDPRIFRKIEAVYDEPEHIPPNRPSCIRVPAAFPLAPMMPELPMGMMDVLDDAPELLSPTDYGLKDLD